MTRLRVLYVYDGDWPKGATRVRKQTAALGAAGHDVLLVCRNESRDARREDAGWMEVVRLPAFPGFLNRPLNFPLFFSPIWLWQIMSAARRFEADVLVVEDLPLAPAALVVGRLLGRPVVYDMGEVYPEFLKGLHAQSAPSLLDRVLRNPTAARWLERWVVARADHTTLVSEESQRRALRLGVPPFRLSIVGNTPEDVEQLVAPTACPPPLVDRSENPIVLFVGVLIHDRGLFELVRAMPAVLERVPSACLVVVGDGKEADALRSEVRVLGIGDHVVMAGWRQHDELPAYYQRARVGLLPFRPGGQIDFTLANKLFDYMGAGLPVVATDVPPMRRVIEEAGAGILVDGPTPESLADGIVRVLTLDRAAWEEMSRRGRSLVTERYNWAEDARRFVAAVEGVAAGSSVVRVE